MNTVIRDAQAKLAAKVIPFLTHPDEPENKYAEYLSQGPQSSDDTNSRNLFADSNREDRQWFKLVRKHLRHLE